MGPNKTQDGKTNKLSEPPVVNLDIIYSKLLRIENMIRDNSLGKYNDLKILSIAGLVIALLALAIVLYQCCGL